MENLVTVVPGHGSFVSAIKVADLNHISDVRAQLETYAAARASEGLAQSERAELDSLLAEIEMRHRRDDPGSLIQLDARVHRFIHRCARNPYPATTLGYYLKAIHANVVSDTRPAPAPDHLHPGHPDVLRAIETGDSSRPQMLSSRASCDFRAKDSWTSCDGYSS